MSRDDIKGPKWDLTTGIPNLTGKIAIVTGANSPIGIGWNTAHQLAINGAKVYVGARTASKAEEGISEMRKASPGKDLSLEPFIADLADLKAVKVAVHKFIQAESKLDILVNNAGLLARPLDMDSNGISVSFLTNHLAPFLLTTELLPIIKKTAFEHPGVRVVTLSSTTHTLPEAGVKFSSVEDFNVELGGPDDFMSNLRRYGLSKLANILFTKELQNRFDKENIDAIAVALHPGGVTTDGSIKFVKGQMDMLAASLSPIDGALTSLFAATNPAIWEEKDKYKAQYLMPFGVVQPSSDDSNNAELASELWKTSDMIVKNILAK